MSFTQEQVRFITEFVVLENYPEATITNYTYSEGLEINREGVLVSTATVNVTAQLHSSCETLTINLTVNKP